MKTEFTDVSETQKTLSIEIPSDVVDAEINRIAKGYTKQARIPTGQGAAEPHQEAVQGPDFSRRAS